MEKLNEVKQAVQTLYQIARQAPVSAEVHDRTLAEAQKVMTYLEQQTDNSDSVRPEIAMPEQAVNNRAKKPETAKAGGR